MSNGEGMWQTFPWAWTPTVPLISDRVAMTPIVNKMTPPYADIASPCGR